MKLNIYALYNLYLQCSDQPQFSPFSPKDYLEGFRRQIQSDPEGAFKYHTQEKELRCLGSFDDITGTIELLPQVQRLGELRQYFPQKFLELKAQAASQEVAPDA